MDEKVLKFLKGIYHMSDGNTNLIINKWQVAASLDQQGSEMEKCVEILNKEGTIILVSDSGGVSITKHGIQVIRENYKETELEE